MSSARFSGAMLLLISLTLTAPLAASVDEFIGDWEGELTFRGDSWPLRIHTSQTEDGLQAKLDLPELVMAWEPVLASLTDDGLRVDLPFGFDGFTLRRVGDRIGATRKLESGELLRLRLDRTAPAPFDREEIRFSNGDLTLTGTLLHPRGKGPHPTVVLVQGSGPQGRDTWSYRSWADLFVRRGIATLYYDKRGVGGSAGNWREASLSDLAGDLQAALVALRARTEVGPIGLCGGSQGGWVALLAAARSDAVSFMVLRSTAAVTPAEQTLQRVEYGMRAAGFPEDEVQDARAYLLLYFSVVHRCEGWPLLRAAARDVQSKPWSDWVDQPRHKSDLRWWEENHDLDPRPLLESISIPVLALYGGVDTVVPPIENAEKLRAFYGGHPTDLTIEVFPGADHRGELPLGIDPDGQWRFPRIAPGLLATLVRWLDDRRLVSPAGEPE